MLLLLKLIAVCFLSIVMCYEIDCHVFWIGLLLIVICLSLIVMRCGLLCAVDCYLIWICLLMIVIGCYAFVLNSYYCCYNC